MQGYPFGTFLYWQVGAENSGKFKFYDFVLDHHERDNPHCPQLGPLPDKQLTAVLDGQQRLTALNIGLRGSMAWKRPRLWWNNPDAFPNMRYKDRLAFALLSLLFPFVDLRHQFHVDHIFPQARFTARRLKRAGVPDEKLDDFVLRKDGLASLQLLQGAENIEKRAKMPSKWLSEQFPDTDTRREYQRRHLLEDVPDSIVEFDAFHDARRARLKKKTRRLLG